MTTSSQIWTSIDSGLTWNLASGLPAIWFTVASSADGSKLVTADFNNGKIVTSATTTTPGIAGSLSGGTHDAVELQYLGNDSFGILSHEGVLGIQ